MLKLRNETKIGLLAIVAVALGVFGFQFLKGINLFTSNNIYYARYQNVSELRPSSYVLINGFQVGTVTDMYVDEEDDRTIIVEMSIDGDVDVPKDTRAVIISLGIMGGKAIDLQFKKPCEGGDCAESGTYLQGGSISFVESIVGEPGQIDEYMARIQVGLTTIYDSIADPNDPKGLGKTLVSLQESLENLAIMTAKINKFLDASTAGFAATANNTAEITRAIRESNADIATSLANLSAVSEQLKNAELDKSAQKAGIALDSVTASVSALRSTLLSTEKTIAKIDTLAQGLANGEGSAGKLLSDEELYDNMVRTSRHLQLLLQDLRLNPKRYNTVKLKVFGKNKTGDYQNPLDDPAYLLLIDSLEREYSKRVKQ
ncbi:MAG: MlaD family protein [Saprospiraceae bacterium]|jgi:phospholipid/cholesterol/gamma-HCH transport system substrate-binding protein